MGNFTCLRPLPKYARGTVDEGKGLMRSVGAGCLIGTMVRGVDDSRGRSMRMCRGGARKVGIEGKGADRVNGGGSGHRRADATGKGGEWWRQWSQESGCDREGGGDPHRLARTGASKQEGT